MAEVSIVIPVYNTGKYLKECVHSLQAQTFRDFEAIFVNDGSTDDSLKVLEELIKGDNRFKVFTQTNQGPSAARNAGIEIATAEWITFIDSDDAVSQSFIELMVEKAHETSTDIVCCQKKNFYNAPKYQAFNSVPYKIISGEEACINALYQNDKPDYSIWNKLYRKSIWATRRFPTGKFFEDMATIPSVLLESKKIVFIPRPLYYYRKRASGILSTAYNRKKAELLDIAEGVYAQFKEKSPQLKKAAESNLFSASCSILIRTDVSEDFRDYRERAWKWLKKFRIQTIFAPRSRLRNKIAAVTTFLPYPLSQKILKRGVR